MSTPSTSERKRHPLIEYFTGFRVLKETRMEFWGLQGINALDCLAYFAMYGIVIVSLSSDFGFNDIQAGAIFGVFATVTTLCLFIAGMIADWLGIKRALYIAIGGTLLLRGGMVLTAYMEEPVRLHEHTALETLHDGEGVPFMDGPDMSFTTHNGVTFQVDLGEATTVGDVLSAINNAPGNEGRVVTSIAPGGKGLSLQDTTESEDGVLIVLSTPTSEALGLAAEVESNELLGSRIITALNGVAVTDINQGEGLGEATSIIITSRDGQRVHVDDLQEYTTMRDVIDRLNATAKNAGIAITVGINNPGTGLKVYDSSGNTEGVLKVEGDGAKALRIVGEETGNSISGKNLLSNPLRSWLAIILLVAMAPFMAMLQTVFQAANKRFTTEKSRSAGFNIWYLSMNLGAAAGGFAIDIIYLKLGLPHFHVFTVGLITGVVCLILIFLTIKRTEQLRGPDEEEEEPEPPGKKKTPWIIMKAVVTNPVFWRFGALITLLIGVRSVFTYMGLLHPKFWYRVIGPDAQVGALQAFNPILVIIGLILVIPMLGKFNVYKMLVFGALITSLSMFIIAIPPMGGVDVAMWTYGTTIGFLLFLTFGELLWSPRLMEYCAAIAPKGQEGTYFGLANIPLFLAKLIVSSLSGVMLKRWCPEPPVDNPLYLQEQIAAGEVAFVDSPYMMFTILGLIAIGGVIGAILGYRWFTKGADFTKAEK